MKIINKIRPAFTLIEILIATAIFSLLMVVTSGIVAESSGYQAKIKALRNASMETRKVADFISNEVRSANGSGTINYENSGGLKSKTYSSSLAIFACDTDFCNPVHLDDTGALGFAKADRTNLQGNVLITFAKEDNIVHAHILAYNSSDEGRLYLKNVSGDFNLNDEFGSMGEDDLYSGKSVTNETGVGVVVNFGGFAPATEDSHLRHPYVTFLASAKTLGYADLAPVQRATASIRSMVVTRSY